MLKMKNWNLNEKIYKTYEKGIDLYVDFEVEFWLDFWFILESTIDLKSR